VCIAVPYGAARAEPPAPEAAPEAPAGQFTPPQLKNFVEAPPPASMGERTEAEVVLTIDVDETGSVKSVEVAQPAGGDAGPDLDAAAVVAARQFKFEPGRADGKPVPVRITYSYKFVQKAAPPPLPKAPPPGGPTVPVTGVVLRRGDRVPVAGVTAVVTVAPGDDREAVTNAEGRFSFPALPVGKHTLLLRGPDTAPADSTITLNEGKGLDLKTYVDVKERFASTVRGQRAVVEAVEHTLVSEEIKKIPGTQGDTLKSVQSLPGVSRAPFGIGSLPVWGSAPQDTRVYVDGVSIPLLYHFGGLRSTFNSEMVQQLTFVPGGYQVEHGLGMGGLVEIETRLPRTDGKLHGYAQIDVVDGSVMLEGRLTKTLSFAVAGRRSWLEYTLPLFTSNSLQLTPTYYDYQARLTWTPSPENRVDVIFFGSDDKLKLVAEMKDAALAASVDSHTYFHRAMVVWTRRFARGATFVLTPSIGYDVPFGLGAQFSAVPTSLDQKAFSYATRAVVRLPLAETARFDLGVDFEGQRFVLDRTGASSIAVDPSTAAGMGATGGGAPFRGGVSGFSTDHLVLLENAVAPFLAATVSTPGKRFTIVPQFRLQVTSFAGYQNSPNAFSNTYVRPDPRLMMRFALTARVALKAAAGLYTQPPDAAAFSRVFGNTELPPQRAAHFLLGTEIEITPSMRIRAEGFYKDLANLAVLGANPGDPPLVASGRGRAYGGEILVRQDLARKFFGWLSYTLSRSQRLDHPGEAWHPFQFDQTHIFTVVASRLLPKGFQVGAKFRYVTGTPTTPINGSFYDVTGDRYTPISGPILGTRLPAFNQLDIRVDKTFTFDRWRFAAYIDVQNVFFVDNPEAFGYNFDYTIAHPISGLPFLPVLGVRGDF
jgi:TonB family protein